MSLRSAYEDVGGQIADGSFASELDALFRSRRYDAASELLNRARYWVDNSRLGEDGFVSAAPRTEKVLDALQHMLEPLEGVSRPLFMSLVKSAFQWSHESWLASQKDFDASYSPTGFRAAEKLGDREKLSVHPFARAMRNELIYADREAALDALRETWSSGDRQAFLYLFQALQENDSVMKARGYDVAAGALLDEVALHPDLQLVVLGVPRATLSDLSRNSAQLPPLRIVVSNKPMPTEYDAPDGGEADGGPEFWLLSAKGVYTTLRAYLADSFREPGESVGHGPYYYASNDDRGHATAANVMAAVHGFLKVPNNFAIDAQTRLKGQLESTESVLLGPVYAHKYLRDQEMPLWATALTQAYGMARREGVDFEAGCRELVVHGMGAAVEMFAQATPRTDEDQAMAQAGIVAGVNQLLGDMKEISSGGEDMVPALERYERERGFHPDAMLFPVSERKRLAFQDLSDAAVATLTNNVMMLQLLDRESEILAAVPYVETAGVMLGAGDVTNFMRLYETPGVERNEEVFAALKAEIGVRGCLLTEWVRIRETGVRLRALASSDGEVSIRTQGMLRYKSARQIAQDDVKSDAASALVLLEAMTFDERLEHVRAEQIAGLKECLTRQEVRSRVRAEMSEADALGMSEFKPWLHVYAEEIADEIPGASPDVVHRAISEATGTAAKPLLGRITKALSGAASLVKSRM